MKPAPSANSVRGGLLLCSEKSKQMLESIVENQSKMMDNQQQMMQMIIDTISNIQYLSQSLKSSNASAGSTSGTTGVPVNFTSDIMNPVNSVEELNALEELLKDDAVMKQYVNRLSFICGNSGRANGIDCCYKLIDHFVTRPFLVQCSWTGNSRPSISNDNGTQEVVSSEMENGKVAIKFYKKFRALFLNLIILADSSFTEMECENFFKRIMKNSKQRVLCKMSTSKHRNRPKNLKYNIHRPSTISIVQAPPMEVSENSASETYDTAMAFNPFERPN